MIKHIFTGVLLFCFLSCCLAQAEENPDELYRQGRFSEAEKAYALYDMDKPKDIRYRYNRGCSAYQNSDFKGARASFSSVLRRTENEEIQFKAAYNLGNAAFKENDFESAVAQYKEALLSNPESEDAKYNLELSLRELEKLKKKKSEEQKKKDQKTPDQSKDKEDPTKSGEKTEGPDQKQPEAQDQKNGKAQKETDKQEGDERAKDERPEEGQKAEQESPKDLSGELTPLQAMPEQGKDQTPDQVKAMLDKIKAEALLDNLNEDRSRFLRFQIPEDKKRGVQSGKDW